jgi:hypothetical protein
MRSSYGCVLCFGDHPLSFISYLREAARLFNRKKGTELALHSDDVPLGSFFFFGFDTHTHNILFILLHPYLLNICTNLF